MTDIGSPLQKINWHPVETARQLYIIDERTEREGITHTQAAQRAYALFKACRKLLDRMDSNDAATLAVFNRVLDKRDDAYSAVSALCAALCKLQEGLKAEPAFRLAFDNLIFTKLVISLRSAFVAYGGRATVQKDSQYTNPKLTNFAKFVFGIIETLPDDSETRRKAAQKPAFNERIARALRS